MPTIIPVKFAYAARKLWFNAQDVLDACQGDHVICQTERGLEIGMVMADPAEVTHEELSARIGNAELKSALRIAADEDLDRAEELAEQGKESLPIFKRLARESGLDMKAVAVEYLFDGQKVVCYFSAEDRIDFRQLVRDLSHELHERIDMRQIGVREEAAIVGGYGHCGQELCCKRFGLDFEPVSIRMAKDQDLPLNSSKISGACGRLMCCLRYELEAYLDFKARSPKRNAIIDTPVGKAKVIEFDTPKEQIGLRFEDGTLVKIPLEEMEASPRACSKAQDQGCCCRPDSVGREALERLNSPEIQAALAELDMQHGVQAPVQKPSSSDIFVEPKRNRRAKGRVRSDAMTHVVVEGDDLPGISSFGKRRATQNSQDAPAEKTTRGEQGARGTRSERSERAERSERTNRAEHSDQRPGRRRRSVRVEREQAQDATASTQGVEQLSGVQAEETPKRSRTRRRHHSSADAPAAHELGEQKRERTQPKSANQADGSESERTRARRRTRRPGDRGGNAAAHNAGGNAAGGNVSGSSASGSSRTHGARASQGVEQESGTDNQPRRHRQRRRHNASQE